VQPDEGTPGGDDTGTGAEAPDETVQQAPAAPAADAGAETVAITPAAERSWAETTPLGSWEQPQPEVPGQGGHWVATTAMPPSMAPTAAWPHEGEHARFPAAPADQPADPGPPPAGPPSAEPWAPWAWAPMDAAAPAAQPPWNPPPGPAQVPPPPGPAVVPVPPMPPPAQWPAAAPSPGPWGTPSDQPSYFTPAGVAPPPQAYGAPVPYEQPYPPAGYPAAGYPPYGYARPTEGLATAAMVTSSLGVLFTLGNFVLPGSGLLGIGLAVAALILVSQAKRRFAQTGGAFGGEGMLLPSKIMAIATIVLNVIGFLLIVVFISLFAISGFASS
jgi:hypothetical protein